MMKTEVGAPAARRSLQIGPPGKQQAPSGVSDTDPVSLGADWQGASSEANSSLSEEKGSIPRGHGQGYGSGSPISKSGQWKAAQTSGV